MEQTRTHFNGRELPLPEDVVAELLSEEIEARQQRDIYQRKLDEITALLTASGEARLRQQQEQAECTGANDGTCPKHPTVQIGAVTLTYDH